MKKKDTIDNKITVSIKNKKEQLFLGEATSITSKNDRGIFDILPFHVNFITLIYDFIVIDRNLNTEKRFEMENGILYTLGNKIDIYIGL